MLTRLLDRLADLMFGPVVPEPESVTALEAMKQGATLYLDEFEVVRDPWADHPLHCKCYHHR